jgi:hypothetical protein
LVNTEQTDVAQRVEEAMTGGDESYRTNADRLHAQIERMEAAFTQISSRRTRSALE